MFGWFGRIEAKVNRILTAVEGGQLQDQQRKLIEGNKIIMATQAETQAAIDAATKQVEAMTSVAQAATQAINGIPQRIADAVSVFQAANPGVDVSALTAAVNAESANAQALSAAITANTPAAPTT